MEETKKDCKYTLVIKGGKKFKVRLSDGTVKSIPKEAIHFSTDEAKAGASLVVEFDGDVVISAKLSEIQKVGRKEPKFDERYATAAYNFISQKRVLSAPTPDVDEERYSGTLTCSLTARTPLLVAGEGEQDAEDAPKERTFCEDKTIPGSSLKGLIRSVVETLTCSEIKFYNNSEIFIRKFQEIYYKNKFNIQPPNKEKVDEYEPQKAGYLIRRNADFYIVQAGKKESVFCKFPQNPEKNPKANPAKTHVITGPMDKKERYYDFTPYKKLNKEDNLKVPREALENFFIQLTSEQEKFLKDNYKIDNGEEGIRSLGPDTQIPVFYLTKKGEDGNDVLDFFGLALYFRIPCMNKPSDFLTNAKDTKNELDMATQIFGFADANKSRRGKVSFSPAIFPEDTKVHDPVEVVLGKPQISCFVHYLTQGDDQRKKDDEARCDPKKMTTYNSKAGEIRGRKMYWHRKKVVKPAIPSTISQKVRSRLHPLEEDAKTTFTIRVDHITKTELGALLEAIDLPEGHAHKLGMGKALGFGSVRIDIEDSTLQSTSERYKNLKSRCLAFFQGEKETEIPDQKKLREEAREKFRSWLCKSLGTDDAKYMEIPHIHDFYWMTDYKDCPKNDRTAVMDVTEFKDFRVLPLPTQV